MDNKLFTVIDEMSPKFNPQIANGIVTHFMKSAEDHVIRTFQAASESFPEELKFIRLERVEPYTQFVQTIYDKSYNVAPSDTYMVRVIFEWQGKPLPPYYLSLPIVGEAGVITMNGSRFLISPVMVDEGLSVGSDSIFIHVAKDKINFMREHYAMKVNGNRTNGYLIYSDIYNGRYDKAISKRELRRTRDMKPLLCQYFLALEGVTGAFKKYFNAEVIVGREEIHADTYPADEWVICSSLGVKPLSLKGAAYEPVRTKIAIPKAQYNLDVQAFAMGIFYNLDHFYERADTEDLDNPSVWKLFLGMTLRPEEPSDVAVLNSANRNLESLKTHLDVQMCASLAATGIYVNNVFELMLNIMATFTQRIVYSSLTLTQMYGKRLVVQRYILSNITEKIFKLGYRLSARTKKLKEKDVHDIIKNHISINDIGRINYKHAEVESANNPTDNIIARLTSRVVLQKDLTKDSNSSAFTPDLRLSASIGEVGTLTAITGDHTGRSKLNMYVQVDNDGTITRNPELAPIIDEANKVIER